MACRYKRGKETKDGRHDFGRVEEFNNQREVDEDTEHVGSVDLARVANSGDTA
jgi:hypothetical protein